MGRSELLELLGYGWFCVHGCFTVGSWIPCTYGPQPSVRGQGEVLKSDVLQPAQTTSRCQCSSNELYFLSTHYYTPFTEQVRSAFAYAAARGDVPCELPQAWRVNKWTCNGAPPSL